MKLTFRGPLTAGQEVLTIEDDGEGMTLEIVKSAWMEPATVFKHRQNRSAGGLRVTGEKGIGRFASARVAHRLELDSVSAEGRKRVKAWFNWGDFEADEKFLDQVRCRWEEGSAPQGRRRGTWLTLQDLREDWSESDVKELRVTLARLLPPTGQPEDFHIEFVVKDDPSRHLSGPVAPPGFLEHPPVQACRANGRRRYCNCEDSLPR